MRMDLLDWETEEGEFTDEELLSRARRGKGGGGGTSSKQSVVGKGREADHGEDRVAGGGGGAQSSSAPATALLPPLNDWTHLLFERSLSRGLSCTMTRSSSE